MDRSPSSAPAIVRTESSAIDTAADNAETLGIMRHVSETYSVGGYSYSSLTDAIAQARRLAKSDGPPK